MIYINNKRKNVKKVIYTIIFSVIFLAGYTAASILVMQIARDASVEVISDNARDQVTSVKARIENGRKELEVAAKMIANEGVLTYEDAQRCADAFEKKGMLCSVSILLPSGEMLYAADSIKMDEALDYNSEMLKVPYISDVKYSVDGERYSYWAVPISDGSATYGIVYGLVDLNAFSEVYTLSAYDSRASLYVIDGTSKELVLSTVGEDIVYESSDIGIDLNNEDLSMGTSGQTEYISKITGEWSYAYYIPLGIKNWTLILTVPRSSVFSQANKIQNLMFLLALLEIACVLSYLLWNMRRFRKESVQQQQQLEQLEYMLKVQQILFDAHKMSMSIIRALESVANMLTADTAFVVASDGMIVKEIYYWRKDAEGTTEDVKTINIRKAIPGIASMLAKGKSVLVYRHDKSFVIDKKDKDVMKEHNMNNIMVVPALDSSNRLVGLIGVANMTKKWEDAILLECVVRNFMMALTNLKSYRLVQKMGTVDSLTGLLNRNSYQQNLRELSYNNQHNICCVYMDANGLHELNNNYGHKAGDDMLKYIGKSLIGIFGEKCSYRIGGDEFVVLCREYEKNQMNQKIYLFVKNMMEKNYYISIGMAWRNQHSSIEETVATAEKKMYEDKRLFYESLGRSEEARI